MRNFTCISTLEHYFRSLLWLWLIVMKGHLIDLIYSLLHIVGNFGIWRHDIILAILLMVTLIGHHSHILNGHYWLRNEGCHMLGSLSCCVGLQFCLALCKVRVCVDWASLGHSRSLHFVYDCSCLTFWRGCRLHNCWFLNYLRLQLKLMRRLQLRRFHPLVTQARCFSLLSHL